MTQPQPRRRLRRRSTDNDNDAVIDFLRHSPTELSSPPQNTELQPEVVSSPPDAIAMTEIWILSDKQMGNFVFHLYLITVIAWEQ